MEESYRGHWHRFLEMAEKRCFDSFKTQKEFRRVFIDIEDSKKKLKTWAVEEVEVEVAFVQTPFWLFAAFALILASKEGQNWTQRKEDQRWYQLC